MHSAVIDPETIREASRRFALPSDFRSAAAHAEHLREDVEHRWPKLPAQQQAYLYRLAASLCLDPPKGPWEALTRRIRTMLYTLLHRRPDPDLDAFIDALNRLAEAIIDAVERESPNHAAQVAALVGQSIRGERVSDPMKMDEFRDWLATKLPDKTAR